MHIYFKNGLQSYYFFFVPANVFEKKEKKLLY